MHKEDILKEAKFYEHFLNKWPVYLKGQTTLTKGPFLIEEIKIEWLDIPKTSYDMRYILRHKYDSKCTISVKEGDIILHLDDTEKQSMYYHNHRWDPKFMENMMHPVNPVDSSLKALDELNRREAERIAASPIRFAVDDMKMEGIKMILNNKYGVPKFEYKKIIFNGPCTIILWKDGTKTIAKTSSDEEVFDPEKGVAICFMKKILGHTETNKILRKANKDYYDEIARVANKQLDEELKKSVKTTEEYFGTNRVVMKPWDFGEPIDNNKVIKIPKEDQDDNLAVRSCCSTCVYADKPMTKDPCCHCLSGDQYKKREDE